MPGTPLRIIVSLIAMPTWAMAEVRLPAILSSHAMLQRSARTAIWGWATAGEKVTIRFAGITGESITGADGRWRVELDLSQAPPQPSSLTVAGGANTITLDDILLGDVWLSSGQSNMQFTLNATDDGWEEIERSADPSLRWRWFMAKPGNRFLEPQDDIPGEWVSAGAEATGDCSGVAYYFGKKLRKDLGTPVGLVLTAVGGSTIQSWMSGSAIDGVPDLKAGKERLAAGASTRKKGRRVPPQEIPSFYYNQMIHPLSRMTLKGFIWYQGESHFNQEAMYALAFPAMIRDWRASFGQGALPFYYCQLPNIEKKDPDPAADGWISGIREAQDLTLQLPATGQVVLIDAGAEDLHPTNKKIVGDRLALLAEARSHGRQVKADSPRHVSHERRKDGRVAIRFSHCEDGLVARPVPKEDAEDSGVIPDNEVHGFAIQSPDGKWRWARAVIKGAEVELWSPDVPAPVAVRYAWGNNPTCNLFNKAGLPAAPFRVTLLPQE